MRYGVLFLCVLTGTCGGPRSMMYFRPTDQWRLQKPTPRWYTMLPGERYRPAWVYVKQCSGLTEEMTGGRYEDVKWMVVSAGGLRDKDGGQVLGVWLWPNTIVLDSVWIEAPWLVAHELLHHLRHIQNTEEEQHPEIPFTNPCMLTYYQNIPVEKLEKPTLSPWINDARGIK